MAEPELLVEHFFRHEFGRVVATLVKKIGVRHLELAEDSVQSAMMRAIQNWGRRGLPDDPKAWLYRTAYHQAIDSLRRHQHLETILRQRNSSWNAEDPSLPNEHEIEDASLRLLFVCCHDDIPLESRIALALKNVCGFGVREIARALLTTEVNINKRLFRARSRLKHLGVSMETPAADEIESRLDAVLMVVYLVLSEGCYSTESDVPIRQDLAEEAGRLLAMLTDHQLTARPETFALRALSCFHFARLPARTDAQGCLILLNKQDRSHWNWAAVRQGMYWLERSAQGIQLSRFHVEAAIAWEHCRSSTFDETDWQRIMDLYDVLEHISPSPLNVINKAVAKAQLSGPAAGLAQLHVIDPSTLAENYPGWYCVAGELYFRNQAFGLAERAWQQALARTTNTADRRFLESRLVDVASKSSMS